MSSSSQAICGLISWYALALGNVVDAQYGVVDLVDFGEGEIAFPAKKLNGTIDDAAGIREHRRLCR